VGISSGHSEEHIGASRVLAAVQSLHERLDAIENLAGTAGGAVLKGRDGHGAKATRPVPAWQRRTAGEERWQVALATAVAIALQLPLSGRVALVRPTWILPVAQALLLVGLIAANPRRIERQSRGLRMLALALTALISLANAWSAVRLVVEIAQGTGPSDATSLLGTGGAIWLTNIIVFALWYWEWDRGGPVARALATRPCPDFLFPQMQLSDRTDIVPADWEPAFGDYLYLAFTNATAFSPTDVMPLSRWAKTAMTVQSLVSLATAALIVARAVNILRLSA